METIESQIKNCVYDGDTYRPDIASILTTRLLNYIDVYFEKKGVKSEPVIERIVKIVESKTMLFTEDLVLRIVSTMIKKYPQKTVKLMSVKSIQSSLLL